MKKQTDSLNLATVLRQDSKRSKRLARMYLRQTAEALSLALAVRS
jgi:hypothetical protein